MPERQVGSEARATPAISLILLLPQSVMKLKSILFLTAFLPLSLLAGDPPVDHSKADTDGPHVLYRGQKVVVKYVETHDSVARSTTQTFNDRASVILTCRVPQADDAFMFGLQDTLRVQPDEYPLPARMLVLSDIEGNFEAFKMMLRGAKVIDKDFNWTFGQGHLVLLGDYFDRGLNVTECLWLAYKLEREAEAVGGKVHFIIGNHEVLNLEGHVQYVRKKYLENAELMGEPYSRLFDNNSELGRWLRTKNAVERIGDYVFCHGGISPELASTGLSLHEVNTLSRQYLGVPLEKITAAAAQAVFNQKTGIFWYRKAAKNMLTAEEVTLTLDYAKAKRIVVGHTLQNGVTALYKGQVICTDLYHEETVRMGFVKTLWVEDGLCYELDSRGVKNSLYAMPARQ